MPLDSSPLKVPSEDTGFDQQTGIKIGLLEMGRGDRAIYQLDHFVARASLQIEPVQNAVAQNDGLVDAAHVFAA
jgi:hypothetical protein